MSEPSNKIIETGTNWFAEITPAQTILLSPGDGVASVLTSPREDQPPQNSHIDEVKGQTVADMAANRGLREIYADKAYVLATGCLSIWAVLLGASGVVNALQGNSMWSDKVIIAVTTGVTVSVLAAFLGVIRGLFPNDGSQKK